MKKRPSGVWFIFILSMLTVGSSLIFSVLALGGFLPPSLTEQPDFAPLGSLDWIEAIVVSVVLLAATISLFRLRRISILLFVIALAIDIAFVVTEALIIHSMPISNLVSNIFGSAVLVVVIFYARNLSNKKILS